ncbi:MAG: CRISPR-associated helicase Cas3' [Paludibacteraceae bacterium]|nr:CRISPR-associated helicase Cas3' [Paludibacteraceae bacterium]
MEIISHIKIINDKWLIQSNNEHQQNVACEAQKFAKSIGLGDFGYVLGLLHDKGKEKESFQQYIKKESGYEPNLRVVGEHNHAYVGGLVAKQLFPQLYKVLSNPIIGHHRGLYDDGEWKEIMKRPIPQDVHIQPINVNPCMPKQNYKPYHIHHIIRFLFSCLVDADRLDTEAFMTPEQSKLRGSMTSMAELKNVLEKHLSNLNAEAEDTKVNQIRRYVQEQCVLKSQSCVDYYSLTVPTGGGKTLASVLWALNHAVANDLQRIIIAIPYTSIITQTAATLKSIFGENNVLEHHSEVDYGDNENSLTFQLATENWDYPIIVTTNVQFFESLFSNKPSQCRKIHNIAKSVIIFDEVQTLPLNFYQPIIDSIRTLKEVFGSSILFTTASQPVLKTNYKFDGLENITEIIDKGVCLHDKLKRATITEIKESLDYSDLATQITQHKRVLCIVNTRRHAKEIFDHLPKEGITLHLSRMMCSTHIKETINTIKRLLSEKSDMPIRVIATQLIEAGVDIDFPVVYREEAGLDSILQAAGRCNREGKLHNGQTFVFSLSKEGRLPVGYITQTNNARLNMGEINDWFSPDTMTEYFNQLYSRVDSFDKKQISSLCNQSAIQFETAAKEFQLIEDNSIPVYVGYKEGQNLINQLMHDANITYSLMKKLSQYCVNVRQQDFKTLKDAGAIVTISDSIHILQDTSLYDDEIGLTCKNKFLEETIII